MHGNKELAFLILFQSSGLGEYPLDEWSSADAVQARTIATVLP